MNEEKIANSEKVSVNLNIATLSQIDLLVDGGYYSNRSDFINQALREALGRQQSTIDRLAAQQMGGGERKLTISSPLSTRESSWFLGVSGLEREELEELRAQGKTLRVQGYGMLCIDPKIPDELVKATVESISVRGKVRCSDELRKHYGLDK